MKALDTVQELIEKERSNLLQLIGTRLKSSWAVWGLEGDEWWNDAPVVLEFENATLWIDWWKFDELRYQWEPFDPERPGIDLPSSLESPLEWRKDCLPEINAVVGNRVERVWIDESTIGFPERLLWILNGISFEFDAGWLSVYNALDENGVSNKREEENCRRRDIESGELVDNSGISGIEPDQFFPE